jgi:hypothetical protein
MPGVRGLPGLAPQRLQRIGLVAAQTMVEEAAQQLGGDVTPVRVILPGVAANAGIVDVIDPNGRGAAMASCEGYRIAGYTPRTRRPFPTAHAPIQLGIELMCRGGLRRATSICRCEASQIKPGVIAFQSHVVIVWTGSGRVGLLASATRRPAMAAWTATTLAPRSHLKEIDRGSQTLGQSRAGVDPRMLGGASAFASCR